MNTPQRAASFLFSEQLRGQLFPTVRENLNKMRDRHPRLDAGVYSDEHLALGWGPFVCLELIAYPTVEYMCFDVSSLFVPNYTHFTSHQVLLCGFFALMSTFAGSCFYLML